MTGITITEQALGHLKSKLKEQHGASGVRIRVVDSGCSGYAYSLSLTDEKDLQSDDIVSDYPNLQVIVDKASMLILNGTEVYIDREGLNEYLRFNNPNAVGHCGCGESFTLKSQEDS